MRKFFQVVAAEAHFFTAAVRTFRAAGTPIPGNRPTTAIVRSGPCRFTRNPIYLAFSLFRLGLSVRVNSLGLLIMLIPAVALMALVASASAGPRRENAAFRRSAAQRNLERAVG